MAGATFCAKLQLWVIFTPAVLLFPTLAASFTQICTFFYIFCPIVLSSAVTQIWSRVAADSHIQPAFKSCLRQSSQSGQLPGSPMAAPTPRLPHDHTLPLRPAMTGPVLREESVSRGIFFCTTGIFFTTIGICLHNREVVSARPPPTDWETSGR